MKPRVKSEPSLKYTLLQDFYGKVLIMMSHPSEHLRIEDDRGCLQGLSRVEIDRTDRS